MWEHSNEGQYTPYVLKASRFHKPLFLRRTLWSHLPGYKPSWQGYCGPSRSAFRPTEEILRSWKRAYRRERDRNGSIRKRVAIKGKEDLEPESSTERESRKSCLASTMLLKKKGKVRRPSEFIMAASPMRLLFSSSAFACVFLSTATSLQDDEESIDS